MADHSAQRKTNLKRASAVIGGSAVVAMVALGTALGQQSGPTAVATSQMNVGETSTQTTPSTAPAVQLAQPNIKGPAPLPSEEAAVK